jgi:hypothetical protein
VKSYFKNAQLLVWIAVLTTVKILTLGEVVKAAEENTQIAISPSLSLVAEPSDRPANNKLSLDVPASTDRDRQVIPAFRPQTLMAQEAAPKEVAPEANSNNSNNSVPAEATSDNSDSTVAPAVTENNSNNPATTEVPKDNSTPTATTEVPKDNPTPTATTEVIKDNSTPTATTEVPPNNAETPVDVQPASAQAQPSNPVTTADVKILTPTPNTVLDIPATSVILQYPVGAKVELQVNGKAVDRALVGRTETDTTNNLITETWYGVAFKEGENTLTAQAEINGTVGNLATVKVTVRGDVQQLTVESVEQRIPADGRSTATIQGQLLDAQGNRSNRDAVVTLSASAGEFVGADADRDRPGFQVQARQGKFAAKLRSDLNAETVRIRAELNNLEVFNQLEFETALRPSIATGVIDVRLGARGTDYYGSLRDFLPADEDNRTQLDVYSAVFATGKVGDWLFTGAYNSDRALNEDCSGNTGLSQNPENCQPYPVYGDSSTSQRLARSQDSVFLRFERNRDYFMWGDYDTREFATRSQQFTAISRQLHGFKGNYNFGNLQVTGFYGDNVQGFQRDTIAPDGTSGYYFLSKRLLVPGSEEVYIELEEINRPGTVIDRQQLSRGADYDIDYDRGTILFREPILKTDVSPEGVVLVRRIVTTYQFEDKDNTANIFAGRVQYNFSRQQNRESWVGATYFKENQGTRNFELYGADTFIPLGTKGSLIAEYAHSSNNSDVMGEVSGSAYRVEAQGEITDGIRGRAYFRSADTGFANNATVSFVPGQTRYGAEVAARLSPTTNFRVAYDRENNEGTAPRPLNTFDDLFDRGSTAVPGSQVDNSLTTITAGLQQRIGKSTVDLDFIHRQREDRQPNNPTSNTSNQLRSRINIPIANNLTFRAQNELNLSKDEDIAYPDRTIFGLNWQAYPGINVSLNHQFFTSQNEGSDNNSITSLDVTGERKIWDNTTVKARYSVISGFDGMRGQGAVGLNHQWVIAPGLKLDLAYEHIFGDTFNRTGAGKQFAQPFAPGQSASSIGVESGDSYSVGLEYTDNPNFKASARIQHRTSSGGNNTVISASAAGKISPALTALVSYQQANSANQTLRGLGDTANFKVGLAYRDPNDDRFNALLRYEYRKNPSTIPNTILFGSGTGYEDHTLAAEGIYAPNWRWEFYGKYALRTSTTFLADDYVGKSTTSLAQLRATYRVNSKIDVVGEGRFINQPTTGYSETGLVLEAGYYITPNLRLSAGYVFGGADDRDFGGNRSAGGPYIGLTVKVNELFGFGLQKLPPPQQQETEISNK